MVKYEIKKSLFGKHNILMESILLQRATVDIGAGISYLLPSEVIGGFPPVVGEIVPIEKRIEKAKGYLLSAREKLKSIVGE